ncbi:MAG: molybdopterin-dependent oxidoreductase [Thermodesulfobacteriota bacterium]
MEPWKKTSCVCCAQNCGLEVLVKNNRIVQVRPDKENPRSQGYVCRKGMKVAHYQHHTERLTHPLRRAGDGFEQISWDQALDEIAAKIRGTIDRHGPRAFAYMGGAGQACHFEAAFGVRLLRGLGSYYHYSPLAQELTGMFWVHGRTFGRQYLFPIPDELHTDMLLAIGWNGWMSHQMPQARRHLKRISEDPDKLLVVIDPRRSDTARRANMHLPIRPGTDALLTRAMIAIILQEGLHDAEYLAAHATGFDRLLPWFTDFDARAAVQTCGLDWTQVFDLCRLLGTRSWSMHADLGTLMNRHSTVTSYLQVILMTICGRIGVPGGNVFPGHLMPMGAHSDERDPKTWRTLETDFPAIMGTFPPNVLPEEILSPRDDRIRAVLCSGANPLRSYADTSAYEQAFDKLELMVTVDVAMSETAALSHYVLPARSAYEKWDAAFFSWNHPEIYFQMRQPVVEPVGEPLEESEILLRLADRLGLMPPIPESLFEAAKGDRMQYGMALMSYAQAEPRAMKVMPFVLAKTLGPVLRSNNLAALWGLLQTAPSGFRKSAAAAGFEGGLMQGETLFKACLDHPEGLWIGKTDPERNLSALKTPDGKIDLFIPELADMLTGITAQSEEEALVIRAEYPLILMAGRHFDYTANTIMRDPAWNDGKDHCSLLMHPSDAQALGLEDGGTVRITTDAGKAEIRLEVTDTAHPGHVVIPHGCGMVHQGKVCGVNVNRLTKNTNRDPIAATPLHRYVPCRVERA